MERFSKINITKIIHSFPATTGATSRSQIQTKASVYFSGLEIIVYRFSVGVNMLGKQGNPLINFMDSPF